MEWAVNWAEVCKCMSVVALSGYFNIEHLSLGLWYGNIVMILILLHICYTHLINIPKQMGCVDELALSSRLLCWVCIFSLCLCGFSGFLPHSKDMQVRLIGYSKFLVGVHVYEWLFDPTCEPWEQLGRFLGSTPLLILFHLGLTPLPCVFSYILSF